jgi:hypothetical protein
MYDNLDLQRMSYWEHTDDIDWHKEQRSKYRMEVRW